MKRAQLHDELDAKAAKRVCTLAGVDSTDERTFQRKLFKILYDVLPSFPPELIGIVVRYCLGAFEGKTGEIPLPRADAVLIDAAKEIFWALSYEQKDRRVRLDRVDMAGSVECKSTWATRRLRPKELLCVRADGSCLLRVHEMADVLRSASGQFCICVDTKTPAVSTRDYVILANNEMKDLKAYHWKDPYRCIDVGRWGGYEDAKIAAVGDGNSIVLIAQRSCVYNFTGDGEWTTSTIPDDPAVNRALRSLGPGDFADELMQHSYYPMEVYAAVDDFEGSIFVTESTGSTDNTYLQKFVCIDGDNVLVTAYSAKIESSSSNAQLLPRLGLLAIVSRDSTHVLLYKVS